ncbi:autotransporter domain-containing protein [Methylobacterium brachythecii]|uniref:Exported lipase n=1 Tax=Methylobacterium brachythecii TaxID=1176177 RepID=A0A7W6F7S1_9HYPH|nr:autotransporter domain-containing protein [Methylobacterium brachythecii]MBB3903680.1 phospholipase/lecithinase/hemolysin/uncharacterized protein YhjY with autotransporter beta-barrel domain [Methylobacterium brachythecii]GLS44250.1 exported lipase [Methylobacterium brachythecii]
MFRKMMAAACGSLLMTCAGAQAQSAYFTRYVTFGDSLTDNGRILRETGFSPTIAANAAIGSVIYQDGTSANRPAYAEVVPALIGLPYRPEDGYAVGGSRSYHLDPDPNFSPVKPWGLPDQVAESIARIGRFSPRDLFSIWMGYNDIAAAGAVTPEAKTLVVTNLLANTNAAIQALAGNGGREFVVFNQKTDRPDLVTIPGVSSTPLGGNDVARAINAALPGALAPLSAAGLNIHYFDVDALITRLRANPTAFGYGPDGNTPCVLVPSCKAIGAADGGATVNQYITVDGVHDTGRTNSYIAAFLANQLNAPLTIGPQGDLGQSAGIAFSSTLIDFLSAERRRNMAMSVPAMYSADLPGKAPAPVTIPVIPGSPFSVFALGTYLNADRTAQNRAGGGSIGNSYSADFGGVTAGLLYQATPNLVLGAAFNYLNTSVDLRGLSNGRIDLDSFQGSVFASLSYSEFFADGVLTYGGNNYTIGRPGVLNDRLTASPSGDTFTAAARVGYLFDFGSFKAGPVAEMAYAHVNVDPYAESGDPLLTIGVRRQSLEGLTAGGGVQIRSALPIFGGLASPFLNVTAQHDFLDGVRTVSSFQTYAPALLIRTQTGRLNDDVYGRIAGGLDFDLGNGFSGLLTGSTSFARSGGDDRTVSAGVRYRF